VNKRFVHLLLLLSMIFSIAHASILSIEDHCLHESVSEYIVEQDSSVDCGDLCDLHHLFHFAAIIEPFLEVLGFVSDKGELFEETFSYTPPFYGTSYKPPIA